MLEGFSYEQVRQEQLRVEREAAESIRERFPDVGACKLAKAIHAITLRMPGGNLDVRRIYPENVTTSTEPEPGRPVVVRNLAPFTRAVELDFFSDVATDKVLVATLARARGAAPFYSILSRIRRFDATVKAEAESA